LGFTGCYQNGRAILRGLHDLYIQSFFCKLSLFQSDVYAGVIGVWCPVQNTSNCFSGGGRTSTGKQHYNNRSNKTTAAMAGKLRVRILFDLSVDR
jgi:hypothetical protein